MVNRHINAIWIAPILLLAACSTTQQRLEFSMPSATDDTQAQPMWPAPPEVPRYAYVGDLRGESNKLNDAKEKKSLMSRFFAALVGLGSDAVALVDLLRPQQGTVDETGRIYVADPGMNAVFVFDETSSEFVVWNESDVGIPFRSPISVAIAEQQVLVTDSEQGLIFVLDKQGNLLRKMGQQVLKRPTGITYDPDRRHILVSDTDNNDIKVFSPDGELIDVIGAIGNGPGQFNRPTFLHYKNDHLYVADSLNARVQVIHRDTDKAQIIGERGLYVGNFSRPKGVAVDSEGNIYITESYYDHLLIYNPDGQLLLSIGGAGGKPGQFSQPTGVWTDNRDRLFVSDMLNSRVSIFQFLGGS